VARSAVPTEAASAMAMNGSANLIVRASREHLLDAAVPQLHRNQGGKSSVFRI
jgi:hypothetical protein